MRITVGALIAVLAFASWSGVAHAAVVAGSVEDPKGDVPLIVAEEHPRDLKSFEMVYDDDRGILKGTITHWDPQLYLPGYSGYHWFGFSADIGVTSSDGSCDVTSTGSVHTEFQTPDDGGGWGPGWPSAPVWARASVVNYGAEVPGEVFGTPDGPWTYRLTSPAFIRRSYNCVTNIQALHLGSNTVDEAAAFCMGVNGTVNCTTAPQPISVKWISPRGGQTVSGVLHEGGTSCMAESTGPISRTENWVDGRLNDRQVNYPWGCEWDTTKFADGPHDLTVRAYASDGRVTEHTVRVNVANGRSPADPVVLPPVGIEQPVTPTPIIIPRPSPSAGGAVTVAVPGSGTLGETIRSLTTRQAASAARRALKSKYGERYRKRAERGYMLACEHKSALRARCKVKWLYRGWVYRSSLTVIKTVAGVEAVVRVKPRRT